MAQNECLALPSHFTHLGVCYPGSVTYVGISNPDNPQPVTFTTNGTSVPEPASGALFMCALVMSVWAAHIRARDGTKLGSPP